MKDPGVFLEDVAFELSLEGGLASGEWRGGGQVRPGAQGWSMCQAGVDFEVAEREGLGLAGLEVGANDKVR